MRRAAVGRGRPGPAASPIAQTGLLFLNTLFDENAASHIALGQSYSKCFTDGGMQGRRRCAHAARIAA